uniref:Uncharacterized protein n=1 Tax=Anopheles atroparvus TaxID=41427 RepID=A0A182JBP7_ANOAO
MVHILFEMSLYLYYDLCLGWLLGFCCSVMLVGMAQLSAAEELLNSTGDPVKSLDERLKNYGVIYDPAMDRFVEPRANFVMFLVGLLLSLGYFYHDFVLQQPYLADLAPFTLTVSLFELLLFATIPLCTKFVYLDNTLEKILVVTMVVRFWSTMMFLCLYQLCVTMIRVRMGQLQALYYQHQLDFRNHLDHFVFRFKHYTAQIEQINRCFSLPMLLMFLMAMLEMAFCMFECFRVLSRGRPDDEIYDSFIDWASTQMWQALFVDRMASMLERYRLLLLIAAGWYLIPCHYNRRTETFECSRWNLLAFVQINLFFGVCILVDIAAVRASMQFMHAVFLVAVSIDIAVAALLMLCLSLNTLYHRATFVQLLNTLLAQDETTLECLSRSRNGGKAFPAAQGGSSLWLLSVTAILYDPNANRFVERRSNIVMGFIGLGVSCAYFYHDFFLQNRFLAALDSFMLGIVILELLTLASIPLCTVLNSLIHRKRLQELLNVLFADDWVLDSCGCSSKLLRSASVYHWYMYILNLLVVLNGCYKYCTVPGGMLVLFAIVMTVRYLCMLSFLYLYHICVTMVVVRMVQLRALFHRYQREPIFPRYLDHFLERFGHYAALIEQINRSLSPPLLVIRHRWILKLASMVYFTPCSYNEKTGVFEETRWNRAVFGLSFSLAIPFWFANIHLMATRYLRTYSSVLAAVGGIELVIYVSVLTCAMLNVFVHRKRITMLMNVLFRTDWLLDSFGGSAFDDRHYDDNRVFLAITAFMAFGFCCKFSNHKDIASKILSVLIGLRFYAVFLVAFVHRICVNAIKLRMEQLRTLYCSDLFVHNVHFFVERFGRYHRQIAQVDRCLSCPILLLILLVMVQLLYLLDGWYTKLEQTVSGTGGLIDFMWVIRQLWQSLYGVLSYVTISACQESSKQVEETALCTRHFDDYRLQNTRAAKQIQKFLLKNLHQKKKFSACGFFDIDNTVIYMVGYLTSMVY